MKSWYKLQMQYKSIDWIDSNIIYYIWDKPYHLFREIRNWFYCNWNKKHWKLLKTSFHSMPWDQSYLFQLMKCQIDKQIRHFTKYNNFVNGEYTRIRPMKWAKYFLEIILEEKELVDYTNESKYIGPKLNYRNLERYLRIYKIDIYPTKTEMIDFYKKFPEEYYRLKCKYLLYKTLFYYSDYWWN